MRALRLIACAALALPASACTILYLATNPYGDDTADAQDLADASEDVILAAPPVTVFSGASAITAFGDTLYANVNGALWSCTDVDTNSCATLGVLVSSEAGVPTPVGLAASDAGVFWVTGDGIWLAGLDGSNAHRAISDINNPQAIAVDGTRLSWTTLRAGTTVIDSCKVATTFGCSFDGGIASGSNQGQLVAGDANVDNRQLAAAAGYVVWVSNSTQNAVLAFTPVVGGPTSTYDPQKSALGDMSDKTWVTNDGEDIFVSFQNTSDNRFAVYQVSPAQSTVDASPTHGRVNGVAKNFCTNASAGLIGYAPKTNAVIVIAENGSAAPIGLQWLNEGGSKEGALAFAATTHFYFVLAADYTLYRFAR